MPAGWRTLTQACWAHKPGSRPSSAEGAKVLLQMQRRAATSETCAAAAAQGGEAKDQVALTAGV